MALPGRFQDFPSIYRAYQDQRLKMTQRASIDTKDLHTLSVSLGQPANTTLWERLLVRNSEKHPVFHDIVTRLLPADVSDDERTNILKQAEAVGEVFFMLGEAMVPFYIGFDNWLDTNIQKISQQSSTTPLILFEGRDSKIFRMVRNIRHPDSHDNNIDFPASRSTQSGLIATSSRNTTKDDIREWHRKHGTPGRSVIVVDFGFRGTNSRMQQAVLAETNEQPQSLSILLAAMHPLVPLHEGYPQYEIHTGASQAADIQTIANTSGYVNDLFGVQELIQAVSHENALFLQELGAGIWTVDARALASETRRYAGKTRSPEERRQHILASVYEIIARWSFMYAVLGSNLNRTVTDDEARNALLQLTQIIEKYSLSDVVNDMQFRMMNDKQLDSEIGVLNLNASLYSILSGIRVETILS